MRGEKGDGNRGDTIIGVVLLVCFCMYRFSFQEITYNPKSFCIDDSNYGTHS